MNDIVEIERDLEPENEHLVHTLDEVAVGGAFMEPALEQASDHKNGAR